MKKQSILSAAILLSGALNAQGVLNCQQDRLLFPRQTLSNDTENLDIVADQSEVSTNDTYVLTGNAVLNSSEYYLAADKINIQKSNKISNAIGNVKFQNHELMLTGNQVVVSKQGGKTYNNAEQVRFHYPDTKITGFAQKITDDGTEQALTSASYSLCPLGNTDWQIKADNLNINHSTNRGVAKNVVLEFLGIPILYSPTYRWVLQGRESGFLSPSIASYNERLNNEDNGYQVKIPYYINIAPDRDLLLTLNHLSTRGSVLEGVYRQLIAKNDYWQGGRFEIEGHYLDKDDITNEQRWLLNSKLNLSVNDKTSINLTTNRVSDTQYFEDIAHKNTDETALYSEINVNYKDHERDLALSVFAESEQLVNNGKAEYTRAPEFAITKGIQGLNGRYTTLSLLSTNFEHKDPTQATSIRTHLQTNFQRLISTDGYSILPSLNLSHTHYSFSNIDNENRSIATFNIDSKLFLEKKINLFNTNLIQTLTPRLAYRYTPKKDQSALPNFDSADKNDSYEALFSGQEFTGLDRISNANNLTFGVESEFIDEDTGDTYLSLKAGQTFYLDDQRTNLNGNLVKQRDYSNIAASIDFSLQDFTFNNALQYDPETNEFARHDSAITYHLNPRKFLTLAHHDDDGERSAELYGAYPINQKMHVFAGINRSISHSITNRKTLGIAYESCCWALRLAHFQKNINNASFERVTNVELVLKGFASTSSGLAKRLEKEIPNYLANLDDYSK